jgi:hypothetical protein
MRFTVFMMAWLVMALAARAEVYKCEQVDKVIYADRPCATNPSGRLAVDTTSPNGQTQASMTSAERVALEKTQLDKLTRARLKKENAEARAVRQAKPKKQKKCSKGKAKSASKKPGKIRLKRASSKASR